MNEHCNTRREWLKRAGLGLAASTVLLPDCAIAQEKPGTSLSVRDFGATGDGRTDDTQAAQKAIDATLKTGGGCVHFPAGRYCIRKNLVIGSSDRVDITGDGFSSVLLHEVDEPLLLWPEKAACRESSVRNLSLVSSGKDKSKNTPVIACLGGAERSLFQNLLFKAEGCSMGGAVSVEKVMDTTTMDQCLLWGHINGVGLRVAQGSEVRIIGGRFIGAIDPYKAIGSGNVGVLLTGNNGGVHIIGTDIIGWETCLQIGEPGGPSNREIFITHATFDSSKHGIRQIDHAYTSIAGCWSASSDEDQILMEETAEGAIMSIAGGTIFNGGAYGRPGAHNGMVVKAGSFTLSGISIRHNKGTGLLVGEKVRSYTITGCRIHDNGTGAVLNGSDYAVTGCVFGGKQRHLIDQGTGNKSVTANVVPS